MTGTEFAELLKARTGMERERKIIKAVQDGHVPEHIKLRRVPIEVVEGDNRIKFYVSPDYFSIGTLQDNIRMPMLPSTAQWCASFFGGYLPTKRIVDILYSTPGNTKVPARTFQSSRQSIQTYLTNSQKDDRYCVEHGVLLHLWPLYVGHRKDIVLTNKLMTDGNGHKKVYSGNLAIYGWHGTSGRPIQGLNARSHNQWYVDYSHGVRIVYRDVELNGKINTLDHLYSQGILTDDGKPLAFQQYPIPTSLR